MITVKTLKQLLNQLPEDAKCYAYEGERRGIGIYLDDLWDGKRWWIDAGESEKEEKYTEGFG